MLRPEVALARKLRREMTLPEVLLWQQLRRKGLSPKFRKQHPIGPYTADFYCAESRLVVEVDGEAHSRANQPKRDAARNAFMTQNGYAVLRIAAADVLRNMDAVTTAIRVHAARPPPHPLDGPPPPAGEE